VLSARFRIVPGCKSGAKVPTLDPVPAAPSQRGMPGTRRDTATLA
jgi:hypothetical protein